MLKCDVLADCRPRFVSRTCAALKIPARLRPLIEEGLIDDVLQSLMSGKEAKVFLVARDGEIICAKVYKEATDRNFKKAAQYNEGRNTRNTRRGRAINKRSKFGREEQESSWQNAEDEALRKLADAGVRVPESYGLFDGVLLMELIRGEDGEVAPRLNDIALPRQMAIEDHATMMNYVQRMLCVGLVHGDLSEFNVLQEAEGPVIIDLPQAVNAAGNNNAKAMLQRDVANMTQYYSQFAPELARTHYAEEMWDLYERTELRPDTRLTGRFRFNNRRADVRGVIRMIDSAREDERQRVQRMGE